MENEEEKNQKTSPQFNFENPTRNGPHPTAIDSDDESDSSDISENLSSFLNRQQTPKAPPTFQVTVLLRPIESEKIFQTKNFEKFLSQIWLNHKKLCIFTVFFFTTPLLLIWPEGAAILTASAWITFMVSKLNNASYELSTTVARGVMIALSAQLIGHLEAMGGSLLAIFISYFIWGFDKAKLVFAFFPTIVGIAMAHITINFGVKAGAYALLLLGAPGTAVTARALGFKPTGFALGVGFCWVSYAAMFGGGMWGAVVTSGLAAIGCAAITIGEIGMPVAVSILIGAGGIAEVAKLLSLTIDKIFQVNSAPTVSLTVLTTLVVAGGAVAWRAFQKIKDRNLVPQNAPSPQKLAKHGAILVYDHVYDYSETGLRIFDSKMASVFTESVSVGKSSRLETDFNDWIVAKKNGEYSPEKYDAASNNCLKFVETACLELGVQIPDELQIILNWLHNEGGDLMTGFQLRTSSPDSAL